MGYSSWGRTESDLTEGTKQQTQEQRAGRERKRSRKGWSDIHTVPAFFYKLLFIRYDATCLPGP